MIALTALAGGLGAALRFLVDGWVSRGVSTRVPLGTFVVNVTGSFALGLLVASAAPTAVASVIGTGLLGGYTTFSAASVEAVALARRVGPRAVTTAVAHAAAMLAACLLAASLGLLLG